MISCSIQWCLAHITFLSQIRKRMPCSQDLGKLSVQACFEELMVSGITPRVWKQRLQAGWMLEIKLSDFDLPSLLILPVQNSRRATLDSTRTLQKWCGVLTLPFLRYGCLGPPAVNPKQRPWSSLLPRQNHLERSLKCWDSEVSHRGQTASMDENRTKAFSWNFQSFLW